MNNSITLNTLSQEQRAMLAKRIATIHKVNNLLTFNHSYMHTTRRKSDTITLSDFLKAAALVLSIVAIGQIACLAMYGTMPLFTM